MIKIAMMLPNPNDATSMARGAMPMAMLARAMNAWAGVKTHAGDVGVSIELVTRDAWSWSDMCQCDLVFIQRPFTPDHFQLCLRAKHVGVPLWIDYDDALDCLPESNPLWSMKFAVDAAAQVNACCQYADVVTVTTDRLAERVTEILSNAGKLSDGKVRVVPNAHNDYLMPFMDLKLMPRQKIVSWRGSATHDEDLLTVLPDLVAVANDEEFADWRFAFLGEAPWQVRQAMPVQRTLYSPVGWTEYFRFMNEWAGICPAVHIVPLVESQFNHCKSNLAWLEASAVGAVTMAPASFMEFQRPGTVGYEPKEFGKQLRLLLRGFNTLGLEGQHGCLNASRAHIREHLLLSQVNELRMQVVRDLVKRPASKFGRSSASQ